MLSWYDFGIINSFLIVKFGENIKVKMCADCEIDKKILMNRSMSNSHSDLKTSKMVAFKTVINNDYMQKSLSLKLVHTQSRTLTHHTSTHKED